MDEVYIPEKYRFNGECMVPGQSWNAQMELEHWQRYLSIVRYIENKKIFDIACGFGYGSILLAKSASHVLSGDISGENIVSIDEQLSSSGIKNVSARVIDLTKDDISVFGRFDAGVCFETIEHIENQDCVVRNLSNALTEDGILFISTPGPSIDALTGAPYNPYHVRELDESGFAALLSRYFRFTKFLYQSNKPPYLLTREKGADQSPFIVAVCGNRLQEVEKASSLAATSSESAEIQEKALARIQASGVLASRLARKSPPRLIFVPLADKSCHNPADRRRIAIPAELLRRIGYEVAVMGWDDAINVNSDLIICQGRDFARYNRDLSTIRGRRKIVYTVSDATFFGRESMCHHEKQFLSPTRSEVEAGEDQRAFVEYCAGILAGSELQAKAFVEIFQTNVGKVSVLPDPIDTRYYRRQSRHAPIDFKESINILWEGYTDNIPVLSAVSEPLGIISDNFNIVLHVLCSKQRRNMFLSTLDNETLLRKIVPPITIRFYEYGVEAIAEAYSVAHFAINPVLQDRFNWSKPENKSIIYNHMGLPVIASPNPSNKMYIKNGINGFTAGSCNEWLTAFFMLIKNVISKEECFRCADPYLPDNYALRYEKIILDALDSRP